MARKDTIDKFVQNRSNNEEDKIDQRNEAKQVFKTFVTRF